MRCVQSVGLRKFSRPILCCAFLLVFFTFRVARTQTRKMSPCPSARYVRGDLTLMLTSDGGINGSPSPPTVPPQEEERSHRPTIPITQLVPRIKEGGGGRENAPPFFRGRKIGHAHSDIMGAGIFFLGVEEKRASPMMTAAQRRGGGEERTFGGRDYLGVDMGPSPSIS